ncbi:MAG: alpha/beta hydrolase [Acidimicrobiia bacterium]
MKRRTTLVLGSLAALLPLTSLPSVVGAAEFRTAQVKAPIPQSDDKVTVTPLSFEVTNPGENGAAYTIQTYLYEPKGAEGCKSSVLQANHALTTGRWYWDLPYENEKYSIARKIARNGIPFLAYDKLGYGTEEPDGNTLTVENLAAVSSQITDQLRAKGYEHVGLMGHSAGSEESELQAAIYQNIDALVVSGYNHFPTNEFGEQFIKEELPRTQESDYVYFFGDEPLRDHFLFTENADPKVVESIHPFVNNTPSGEITSIGKQPSRLLVNRIDVPTAILVAEDDRIFDSARADDELKLWTSATDISNIRFDGIGHGVEFHRNGPEVTQAVADWLLARPEAMPACSR